MSFTKKELFTVWSQQKSISAKNAAVFEYVINKLSLRECSDAEYLKIKQGVNTFNSAIAKKWKNSNRGQKLFEERENEWLNGKITFMENLTLPNHSLLKKRGRPSKEFQELGEKSKRKKNLPLLENYQREELSFAMCKSLESSGHRDASRIVKEISEYSPNRATQIKKAYKSPSLLPTKYTPEEALAFYVDARLTKKSYLLMQQGAKIRNANIYPSYNILLEAKKKCFPDENFIIVSDTAAEVKLQQLVDHTVNRIMEVQKTIFEERSLNFSKITMFYKWGCDGSGGHSTYKQGFSKQEGSSAKDDSNLFSVCLVPLQMTTDSGHILWQNPRPSSVRYCRPIKILFEKETAELSKREIENVKNQIECIQPTTITSVNKEICIHHDFKLTMIDGKMFGIVSGSSTQTCGICGATPKIMNDLEKIWSLESDPSMYDYGISSLHAWIRCLECCLHISYRIPVQRWQIRNQDEKKQVKERKEHIQRQIKVEMNLLVDIPKQGHGTTNDGNTSRRFFSQLWFDFRDNRIRRRFLETSLCHSNNNFLWIYY